MTDAPKLGFTPFARLRGVLVVFCGENLKFGTATQRALSPVGDLVRRAAAVDRFTGKNGTTLDIVAPAELKLPRLIVIGTGKDSELKRKDVVKLGGIAMGKVPAVAAEATCDECGAVGQAGLRRMIAADRNGAVRTGEA